MADERRLRRDSSRQYEYDITSLRSENENLQVTVKARDEMIEKLQGQIATLGATMDELERRVAEKDRRATVMPERIGAVGNQFNELRKAFDALGNMARVQEKKFRDLKMAIEDIENNAGG
jgi:chromosome segregation ATPase